MNEHVTKCNLYDDQQSDWASGVFGIGMVANARFYRKNFHRWNEEFLG